MKLNLHATNRPQARRTALKMIGDGAVVMTSYDWLHGRFMISGVDKSGRSFFSTGRSWPDCLHGLKVQIEVADAAKTTKGGRS